MQERLPFCALRPSKGNRGLMSANRPARHTMLTLLFLLLISYGVGNIRCSTVPGNSTDMLSLLDFKAIISDPMKALSSWHTGIPHCQWEGVNCSLTHPGRVTVLKLRGLGLSGPISPSLGNLTFLRIVILSTNSFTGELPPFDRLHKLTYLALGNNSLQGTIPESVTNCSSLEVIQLSNNLLRGEIPPNIGLLHNLFYLGLTKNNLTGTIPPSLKNNSQLEMIFLDDNKLTGSIPDELAHISVLSSLVLGGNMLSGEIPEALFNMSSLVDLDLSSNTLGKELPSYFGDKLPNLYDISLYDNKFEGHIPPSLGNALHLSSIDLSVNNFIGHVPSSFGKLENLKYLNLENNKLEAKDIQSWEFIDALSNCRSLRVLTLGGNQLNGAIPNSIGKLSRKLTQLGLGANKLSGQVPIHIGNLSALTRLNLSNNMLYGPIEGWVGKLENITVLDLDVNNFTGPIPSYIGNLTKLTEVYLAKNDFEGHIPPSLGNLKNLLKLNLSYNNLEGNIPQDIFYTASVMIKCVLSYNNIEGTIPPEIGDLKQLNELHLSSNKLIGEIPSTLGNCEGLTILNLSNNDLSGSIPIELSNLQLLRQLDLSYNNLKGHVPKHGVFENATIVSLLGNRGLCGGVSELHMSSCPTASRRKAAQYYLVRVLIPIFGFMSLLLLVYFFITERMTKAEDPLLPPFGDKFLKVSYTDLSEATQNFSQSNVIGRGSYGTVYRGKLTQEKLEVAVKVLDLDMRGAEKSFLSECEALRSIQHRNLVPIITACSTVDTRGSVFKALIYEFMPNGNLDTWLHPKGDGKAPKRLGLTQRINIIVDIADALDYLHNDSGRPIIHCDVKPSNILLDDDMSAHLGDFGIASFYRQSNLTLVGDSNATSSIGLKGTIGYIAPEYAGGGPASTCGDVYSFGILVLELLTSKRPTDSTFEDGLNIINFVDRSFPDQILQTLDAALQEECKPVDEENTMARSKVYECLLSLLEVALSCTTQFPRDRMTMREAAIRMRGIKQSHASGKDNNVSRK